MEILEGVRKVTHPVEELLRAGGVVGADGYVGMEIVIEGELGFCSEDADVGGLRVGAEELDEVLVIVGLEVGDLFEDGGPLGWPGDYEALANEDAVLSISQHTHLVGALLWADGGANGADVLQRNRLTGSKLNMGSSQRQLSCCSAPLFVDDPPSIRHDTMQSVFLEW